MHHSEENIFQWTIDSYQKLYWMPLPFARMLQMPLVYCDTTRLLNFGRTSIVHCEIDERINVRLHLWNYAILEEKN